MERLFIETKYLGTLTIPKSVLEKLPPKLILAMPVQFLGHQKEIVSQLKNVGKDVIIFKSHHGKHSGQILGCDILRFDVVADAFFYIGDGKFHPTALLYENNKPVFCYNPFDNSLIVRTSEELEKVQQKKKGQMAKLVISKNVGLLITTKLGQNEFKRVENLRERLENKGKSVFVFIADEINLIQLENFNFIDVWINTACPRIVEDFKCLNFTDLKSIGY